MSSFNLVDEEWIPCILDGNSRDLGLKEVLIHADRITEIFDPSPVITVTLHRLLLAILHRNFGPTSMARWMELRDAGKWDETKLKKYFAEYSDHFYLFDEERPFYQDSSLRNYEASKNDVAEGIVPLTKLAREMASTSNATLFDHSFDQIPKRFPFKWAARLLVASQFYALQDGRGYSPSPISFGALALVKGNTLFETLLFNLNIYNTRRPIPSQLDKDRPTWERDDGITDSIPEGYITYLTWPYRRMLLIPEESTSEVERVIVTSGPKIDKDWLQKTLYDPFIYYKRTEETGYVPVRLKKDKALWRDSHALISLVRSRNDIEQGFVNLLARAGISQKELHVFGVLANKNKIDLWRHERLPLPLVYLEDEKLIAKLKEALDMSEYGGRLLGPGFVEVTIKGNNERLPSPMRVLAQELLPQDQKGLVDPNAVKSFIDSLSPARPYWARLGISFNRLVGELAKDKSAEGEYGATALPWWAGEVSLAARQAFEEATNSFDRSGRQIKAVTKARDEFDRRLNDIRKPYKENAKKGGEEA